MIQKIINEWTYQLDSGYPTKDSDYDVLRDVLQEMDLLTEEEIDRTILQAKGIYEQPDPDIAGRMQFDPNIIPSAFGYTETEFENIIDSYKVQGQEIRGIDLLYTAIITLSEKDQEAIKNLLDSDIPALELQSTRYQISGILLTLYNIIMKTIKVTNGEPSELWFSIIFKGKVAGAIGKNDDIETDVVIMQNGDRVSLKNYKKTTFDLGTLPTEASQYLKKFESLAALLTGRDPYSGSMSRNDVNEALKLLNSESIQSDIDQFLRLNSDVQLIIDLQERIKGILYKALQIDDMDSIDNITKRFCLQVESFIESKLNLVEWWAFIIKEKNIIYLRDVPSVMVAMRHIQDDNGDYLLGPGIENFKGGKLFIKGTQIGISKRWKDKED